jgi:hypothetical protein
MYSWELSVISDAIALFFYLFPSTKAFQEINYLFCKVGRVRTPVPQENLGYFLFGNL